MHKTDLKLFTATIIILTLIITAAGCNKSAKDNNKPVVINSYSFTVDGAEIIPADILQVEPGSIVAIEVSYTDPDAGDDPDPGWYSFAWAVKRDGLVSELLNANEFFIVYNENPCVWVAPDTPGKYTFDVIIGDRYSSPSVGHVSVLVDTNKQPVISEVNVSNISPYINEEITITVEASDPDGNYPLEWDWQVTGGYFSFKGEGEARWLSPIAGSFQLTVMVTDQDGGNTSTTIPIQALENHDPIIQSWDLDPGNPVAPDTLVLITLIVSDPDGDTLTYNWQADKGAFNSVDQNVAQWRAPSEAGNCIITVDVEDDKGGSASVEIVIIVTE